MHPTWPRAPESVQPHHRVLVVFLGPNACHQTVASRLKSAVLETERGHRPIDGARVQGFVPIPRVKKDLWGNTGIVEDIYAASKHAKQAGWSSLIFFDDLSCRQLEGTTRPGEPESLCVALVHLTLTGFDDCLSILCGINADRGMHITAEYLDERKFYLCRVPLADALIAAFEAPNCRQHLRQTRQFKLDSNQKQTLALRGCLLRDPNEPFFGSLNKIRECRLLTELCLNCEPALPEEIKHQIRGLLWQMPQGYSSSGLQADGQLDDEIVIGQALEGVETRIFDKASRYVSPENTLFFRRYLSSRPKYPGLRTWRLRFQPWPDYAPPTLRELCRLVTTNLTSQDCYYSYLGFLIFDRASGCHYFLTAKSLGRGYVDFDCNYLPENDLFPQRLPSTEPAGHIDMLSEYVDFHETFPQSAPPWKTPSHPLWPKERQEKRQRGEQRSHLEMPAPLFFLVGSMDDKAKNDIMDELRTYSDTEGPPTGWVKSYNQVPWTRSRPGEQADILRLLNVMHSYESRPQQHHPVSAIFIDEQSMVDLQVIVAKLRIVICTSGKPHAVGFDFVRVPGRSATFIWYLDHKHSTSRSRSNKKDRYPTLDKNAEVMGKMLFFPDPALPGSMHSLDTGNDSAGEPDKKLDGCPICVNRPPVTQASDS